MDVRSIAIRSPLVYSDKLQDKTILYNPESGKGILLVGQAVADIFELCDGSHNISSIAKDASISPYEALKIVKELANYGILNIPEYKPPSLLPPQRSILRAWLHITNACNLNCRYCYIKKDGNKMNIETAHKLVDAIHRSINMHKECDFDFSYVLAGGEPLTNLGTVKELLDYSYIQAQRFKIKRHAAILTNGTILNPQIISLIKRHNAGLSISVDGFGEMNQNRTFKNGKSAINIILRNIDKLSASGIKPFILITIAPENLDGLIPFTKYLLENKLNFSYSLVKDPNIAKNKNAYCIDKMITVLDECYNLMEIFLIKKPYYIKQRFETISLGLRSYRGCSLGKRSFVISHDGRIFLCQTDIGRRPCLATIEDTDILEKLWNQKKLPELNQYKSVDNYENCSVCRWRYQCAGGCPMFTKMITRKINRPSPYCAVYKNIIPRLIRINAFRLIVKQTKAL